MRSRDGYVTTSRSRHVRRALSGERVVDNCASRRRGHRGQNSTARRLRTDRKQIEVDGVSKRYEKADGGDEVLMSATFK